MTLIFVNSLWGRPSLLFDAIMSVGPRRSAVHRRGPCRGTGLKEPRVAREPGGVAAHLRRHEGPPPSEGDIEAAMRSEGLEPHRWRNDAGYQYGWHEHGYHKVLYCLSGSIVFHTEGDLELRPGDRLDVEPGTGHAATVGTRGVECLEAPR